MNSHSKSQNKKRRNYPLEIIQILPRKRLSWIFLMKIKSKRNVKKGLAIRYAELRIITVT